MFLRTNLEKELIDGDDCEICDPSGTYIDVLICHFYVHYIRQFTVRKEKVANRTKEVLISIQISVIIYDTIPVNIWVHFWKC